MKTKLILSLMVSTLFLAACGGQAAQSEPAAAQPIEIPTLTPAPPAESIPTEAPPPTEVAASAPATEAPVSAGVSFANDVMPILASSCSECHGGRQTKADLNLTTYEGLMTGSFNGVVILPGSPADSVLVQSVANGEMPKRGSKLTPEQVQVISDWVTAGALNN